MFYSLLQHYPIIAIGPLCALVRTLHRLPGQEGGTYSGPKGYCIFFSTEIFAPFANPSTSVGRSLEDVFGLPGNRLPPPVVRSACLAHPLPPRGHMPCQDGGETRKIESLRALRVQISDGPCPAGRQGTLTGGELT